MKSCVAILSLLLSWTLASAARVASAAPGTDALVYLGNGGLGAPSEWEPLRARLESTCVPAAVIASSWPAGLDAFRYVWIDFPQSPFDASQVADLVALRSRCGRIVLGGDNGAAYDVGPTNELAAALGLQSVLLPLQHDRGPEESSVPDGASGCIVDGVSNPVGVTTGEISPGPAATVLLVGMDGQVLLVEEAGVLLAADLNLFMNVYTPWNASNERLVSNTCTCPASGTPCGPGRHAVCHVPHAGQRARRLCVDDAAIPAHLAHGDTMGDCGCE